ncbi:hypothetical protein [Nodosilinea sp. LEGE 06152]|uniref:hypothetical protein n=1 Tax=Nodosilinea sp. LEGE 06152 TaxID=2777966 RepID=UPI001880BAC6|nr:hypothetical protein [Nodosilinea sp. LEGE 06152]
MLKPLVDQLVEADGRNLNQLAIAYGIAKDGEKPERQDKYRNTLLRIVEKPDSASWENLARFLRVLGVDAEAALTIAISSAAKAKAS